MKVTRCSWCERDELYRNYHDEEWGKPVHDDKVFFEFLILESFQAGLSWHTILQKRKNFRTAFDDFNYLKIAEYKDFKVNELMNNSGIIRHRLKILAAVNNAIKFQILQKEFGSFSTYIWTFVDNKVINNVPEKATDVPSTNHLSDAVAKDLKKRGFKFLGSTTVYAFLQATGLINDHFVTCDFK